MQPREWSRPISSEHKCAQWHGQAYGLRLVLYGVVQGGGELDISAR